ncbi:Uncharacterised protein [Mycobacteroides abscessus subsp. massiliense]|nr:Uncharacterised protein [Mycobacteroides abscessus subsp. massiliense]
MCVLARPDRPAAGLLYVPTFGGRAASTYKAMLGCAFTFPQKRGLLGAWLVAAASGRIALGAL